MVKTFKSTFQTFDKIISILKKILKKSKKRHNQFIFDYIKFKNINLICYVSFCYTHLCTDSWRILPSSEKERFVSMYKTERGSVRSGNFL